MSNSTSVSRYVKEGIHIEAKYIDGDDDEYRWFQGLVKRIRKYNNDSYGRYVECDVLYDDGAYVKGERFYDCDYGDDVWRFGSHLACLVQNLLSKIEEMEYDKYFDDEDYETEEGESDEGSDGGSDGADGSDGDNEESEDDEVSDALISSSSDEDGKDDSAFEATDSDNDSDNGSDNGSDADNEDANEVIRDVVRHVTRNDRRLMSFVNVMVAFACATVTSLLLYKSHPKCVPPFV